MAVTRQGLEPTSQTTVTLLNAKIETTKKKQLTSTIDRKQSLEPRTQQKTVSQTVHSSCVLPRTRCARTRSKSLRLNRLTSDRSKASKLQQVETYFTSQKRPRPARCTFSARCGPAPRRLCSNGEWSVLSAGHRSRAAAGGDTASTAPRPSRGARCSTGRARVRPPRAGRQAQG